MKGCKVAESTSPSIDMNLTLAIIVFVCHRPCCVWGRRETEMEGLDGQTN